MSLKILLDLDGTLTNPFLGISLCIIHAIEEQGLPVPDAGNWGFWIGPPLLQSFARYFESVGGGDPEMALQAYRQRFSEKGLFENTVYDGIFELLKALTESGHRMYLATAKPIVYAKQIVKHFGLDHYITHSYGAELDGTRVDKVDLLQYIIDQENLDPASCVMVGDRKHDMVGARYHGMRAIGVLWGYGSEAELLDAGAEHLVESPVQLLDLL